MHDPLDEPSIGSARGEIANTRAKVELGLIRRNLKIAKLVATVGATGYIVAIRQWLSSMVERYVKLVDLCATELAHEEATRRIPT